MRAEADARASLVDEGNLLASLPAARPAPRLIARGEDDDGPFVVMEHVEGPNLPALVRAPPATAHERTELGSWAAQSFHALHELHTAHDARGPLRLVHGDLAPEHGIVAERGVVFVDFGLARYRDSTRGWSGGFVGRLAYAAPEVIRGEGATHASDVFSLALVWVHLACGRAARVELPSASTAAQWAHAAETEVGPYVQEALDGWPDATLDAFRRSVSPEPSKRPSAAEVAEQLGRARWT
jgi:serine/threonine protein kinase